MRPSPPTPDTPAGWPAVQVAPPFIRTGTDLTDVHRIEELLADQPGLEEELFTARERAYCRRRRHWGQHLAARFAAKEAVLKSLGTGMGPQMRWTDIEIVNERGGRPLVLLGGAVRQAAERLGMQQLDISLTHTAGLAIAHAVLVCTTPEGAPVPAAV